MENIDSLSQLSREVGRILVESKFKLSTVESCTGGWIGKVLTDVAGSSSWYECGYVTYSDASKIRLVGVSPKVLRQSGAVSERAAQEMAQCSFAYTGADIALAVTGIAGPSGGTREKPVGTVWFAWAARTGACKTERKVFVGDRKSIREQTVRSALSTLIGFLEEDLDH